MLFLRLWNYIRGYVIILVEGYFLEKFINICTHRQIFLWDLKRQKNCTMLLKISIKGFKNLRPVAKKTGCRVRIVRKRGIPFILSQYKNRKTFILGAVLFVTLFFVLTSFVWAIDVAGNKKIDTQIILERLAQYGIKPGVLKYRIDTDKVVNKMMLSGDEIGWIGITVKGTKVKVEISERVKPPDLIQKNVPCDITAMKDGAIKSIVVKEGQEMVKVGDTVKKGDILIAGTVENINKEIKPRRVHSIGTVKARTWYEKSYPVNVVVHEKERTGNVKNIYSLSLFNRQFSIFPGSIKYKDFEKIEIKKKLAIGENLVFPLEVVIDQYYESNPVEKEMDFEDAKKVAIDQAYKEASAEIPEDAEIIKTNVECIQKDEDTFVAHVVIECIEDIGITKTIGG